MGNREGYDIIELKSTRKDVAKRAGVSESTVSYVLNGSRAFSEKTKEKIYKAVEDLNYQPDMIARSMVNKGTKQLIFVTPDVLNPYFGEVLSGFESAAIEQGYFVSLCTIWQKLNDYIKHFISRRYDGVYLSIVPSEFDLQNLVRLTQNNIAVLLSGCTQLKDKRISHLNPDFMSGITEAIEYLYKSGHRDIAMLSAFDNNYPYDVRKNCYIKALSKYLPESPINIISAKPPYTSDISSGKELTCRLLQSGIKFTAVLCTNDMMAVGCMAVLKEKGYQIPEDISVIGVDDIIFAREMTPSLSSIGYDKVDFGKAAFRILYENIRKENKSDILVKTEFIKRNSISGKI